jgi:hypothetical protein
MNTQMDTADLAGALAKRGLLTSGVAPGRTPAARPWFIGVVLGAAGWLAGVFALIFVFLLLELEGSGEIGGAGAVLLAAAYGLYRVDRDSAFFEQLALALSIAGQIALGIAVADWTDSAAATAAFLCALEIALLVALPNPLARTLAAFAACIAWVLAVRFAAWDESLFDVELVALAPALLSWLAIFVPLVIVVEVLLRRELDWIATRWCATARPALAGSIAALALATWAAEPFASLPFVARSFETNWLALWPLLGTGMALYAALCAFRVRARALLGLSVAGALLHALQFYYVLGASLLLKSAIMVAVGVALLAAAWALRRSGEPG